jgi:predicted dithiol-disulfide oxidoreductase (DUF899 family)
VTFLCASRAPLEKLQAYKQRMGWRFEWVSTLASEFNFDFGASFTDEQPRKGTSTTTARWIRLRSSKRAGTHRSETWRPPPGPTRPDT